MPLEAGFQERFREISYGMVTYLSKGLDRDSSRKPETLEELIELMEKLASRMSRTSMESGLGDWK